VRRRARSSAETNKTHALVLIVAPEVDADLVHLEQCVDAALGLCQVFTQNFGTVLSVVDTHTEHLYLAVARGQDILGRLQLGL
jgi:hypothetical protein